jgi:nucleoid DNA-binding protein
MVNKETLSNFAYDYLNNNGQKVTRTKADAFVTEMLRLIENTLVDGSEVKLANIGTLRTVYPQRSTQTNLPNHKGKVCAFRPTVRFKASDALRRNIRPVEGV